MRRADARPKPASNVVNGCVCEFGPRFLPSLILHTPVSSCLVLRSYGILQHNYLLLPSALSLGGNCAAQTRPGLACNRRSLFAAQQPGIDIRRGGQHWSPGPTSLSAHIVNVRPNIL